MWNNEVQNILRYGINIFPGLLFILAWFCRSWVKNLPKIIQLLLNVGVIITILFCIFAMFINHETVQEITDSLKYEQLLEWENYPTGKGISHFPNHIPKEAKNVRLFYSDLINGPNRIQVRYQLPQKEIAYLTNSFKKKSIWIGHDGEESKAGLKLTRFRNVHNNGYAVLPQDYKVIVTTYRVFPKYLRFCSGVSISKDRNEIIYWSENRPYDPWLSIEY